MKTVDAWPLVYIGKGYPFHRGQRCKRLVRNRMSGKTLVRFKDDGRIYWVLDRLLVKADEY